MRSGMYRVSMAGALLCGAMASSVSAAIVTQDLFARTGPLIGSAPTTGSGTWSNVGGGAGDYNTDGSQLVMGAGRFASLPVSALPRNSVITLSGDVNANGGGENWTVIGFTDHGHFFEEGELRLFLRNNTGLSGPTGDFTTNKSAGNLKMVIVTPLAGDPNPNTYQTTVFLDGVQYGGTASVTKGIGFMTLGSNVGNTTYDNFTLDITAVPEPAMAGVLGLAGMVLTRRRSR